MLTACMAFSCMGGDEGNNYWEKTYDAIAVTRAVSEQGIDPFNDNIEVVVKMTKFTEAVLDITINDIRFSEMMPVAINFMLKDFPFTVGENKEWYFDQKSVVPLIGGVPNPTYTLQNVKGAYTGNDLILDFDITMHYVDYHVRISTEDPLK